MAINERNEAKKKGKVKRNESKAVKKIYTHNYIYICMYIRWYTSRFSFCIILYFVIWMEKFCVNYTCSGGGEQRKRTNC